MAREASKVENRARLSHATFKQRFDVALGLDHRLVAVMFRTEPSACFEIRCYVFAVPLAATHALLVAIHPRTVLKTNNTYPTM